MIGAAAYKPGLDTVRKLSALTGDSHCRFKVIHVAGTNGKGSTAHTLAAILQSAGYRTGLFTSPHLLDFRERIRIDGKMVEPSEVCRWVENYIGSQAGLTPSFFELTTVMAFDLFAAHHVDVAVVEVGLGGRLDSTNIVQPVLSIITNVSKDHVAQLGNTLTAIASEKAGIIKQHTTVVLGESDVVEVTSVVSERAKAMKAPLIFADRPLPFQSSEFSAAENVIIYRSTPFGDVYGELTGDYQPRNAATVLTAVAELDRMGFVISPEAVRKGFAHVSEFTGLLGRWTTIDSNPLTVCDTGHNEGGWRYLSKVLGRFEAPLAMVVGFVNDKDIDTILGLMPSKARYYFTRAGVPRALPECELATRASAFGLQGATFGNVAGALEAAQRDMAGKAGAMVFVGGSTFVVADALAALKARRKN